MQEPCPIPKEGDRIRLVRMGADPCPLPRGLLGTVIAVCHGFQDDTTQLTVDWDAPRSLSLVLPEDRVDIVNTAHALMSSRRRAPDGPDATAALP